MQSDLPPAPDDGVLEATLDRRIAEMRQMLARMRAADTAGALKALRDAYPDVPLASRVRAIAGRH